MIELSLSLFQIVELLERLALFHGLNIETLTHLAAGSRQVCARRSELVFRTGDSASALHIVAAGKIREFLTLPNHVEKVIASVGRGEAFGMAATCLGEPHPVNAMASKDSHLLVIDRHVLLREAGRDCALSMCLMKEIARLKLGLIEDLESCTPRTSQERVACFLLQHRLDSQMAYDIHLPATKREIAAKLNLAQETLSRTLHQFIGDNIITVQGPFIRVLDATRLLAIRLGNCSANAPIPD